jgi:hypothetical protein
MGGVIDGEPVDAAITNPAFIEKNADDFTTHKLGLQKPTGEGPILFNSAQQALNTLCTASGSTELVPGNTYGAVNNTVMDGDNYQTAIFKLCQKFAGLIGSGGHGHSGVDGDGPQIPGTNISNVPLQGVFEQGVDIMGATGGSTDVTADLTGHPVSTSSVTPGVVSTAPYNKVTLRHASGASEDESILDGSGNLVYGRLTWSGSAWTLTYYITTGGVETPYSFGVATDIRWYYQELFNPMSASFPVYSELAVIPSDNVTADILTATTTLQGKVSLSAVAPSPIAATGNAGTANASVANADHTHEGVHDINGILGSANIVAGSGTSVSTVGQNIAINVAGFAKSTFLAVDLPDNTPTPTTAISIPTTALAGIKMTYSIQRGTGQSRCSDFFITWDGTSISFTDGLGTELGTLGIVLTATVSGGNFNIQFTSTATGTDGTMNAEVTSIPA